MAVARALSLSRVRVISLDVTGTLIRHKYPIFDTYSQAMVYSRFPHPLSPEELAPAFKKAYKRTLLDLPYFGKKQGFSSKQWWVNCVQRVLEEAGLKSGKHYTDAEFDRFFRRVYQHYGCPEGYARMDDALPFLKWAVSQGYLLGVCTNTPSRTMDSVLPFMGLHHYLRFFCCSQDCGSEKPEKGIFDFTLDHIQATGADIIHNDIVDEIRPWDSSMSAEMPINRYQKLKGNSLDSRVQPSEILHIGDSLAADLCGPMQFGWQALHLDRSKDPNVRVYQDWLTAPDYPGKSEDDINKRTVTNFGEVIAMLEKAES